MVVYGLHAALGLEGFVLYTVVGGLAVTTALLMLVMRAETRVPRALALTAAGVVAITPVLTPRAYLFTVCFFMVELYALLRARETGDTRALWLLPPLFAVWANRHIQFVQGMLVLGIALLESLGGRFYRYRGVAGDEAVPLHAMFATVAACGLATLLTPYGVGIYRPVLERSAQRGAYQMIVELAAPTFREPANWVFLALALGAAFVLGRRRRLHVFPTLLLVAGAYFSFLAARDMWFLGIVSVAIIADAGAESGVSRAYLSWKKTVAVAVGVGALIAAVGATRGVTPPKLAAAVAQKFPVAAVAAIKTHGYGGPLYNTFDWGGFLMWTLPQHRVSMDGRANLHGDQRILRSLRVWLGYRDWEADEELHAARLVVGPVDVGLSPLLRCDGRFELVHEDDVAAVFIRRDVK